MAFIYVHYKKIDNNNNIMGGIASIRKSIYVKDKKFHSKQVTVERLGKVIYLSDDKKSGIFDSPIRGLVNYNVTTDTFSKVDEDDPRIINRDVFPITKVHTVFGDSYLLLEFLDKHKLLNVFREVFIDNNDYERFLAHIIHDIMRDGSHITCDNYFLKSFISYVFPDLGISSLKCDSRFFQFMGDDDIKLSFFKTYIKLMRREKPTFGKATYVDSTPLPNDIVNNPFNALCSHGVTQMSIQMRLVLILDQDSGLPVWFEIIPGNVLDISTLRDISGDVLSTLDIQISDYVLDAGYVSQSIIKAFKIGSDKTMTARMPAKKGYPYKELYQNTKELLHKGKYQFKRKDYTYFGIQRQIDIFGEHIYEYVYLDHYNATKGFNAYLGKHQDEFENLKDKDKDFRMVQDGFFILVSNVDKKPKEILEDYYCRADIEKVFKTSKEYLKLLPIGKWNSDAVKGKILTDMISTIVYLKMRRDLVGKDMSIPDIIGSTQSLMCFRDNSDMVTVECPNKKVKECYKNLGVEIPSRIDIKSYMKDKLLIEKT